MWFASHPTGPRLQHQFQTEVTWRSRMADCLRMFSHFSPHLCVGFLFLVVHFRLSAPAPARSRRLPHTHSASPYNLLTHTTCPRTTCHHTTCSHTTCSHTTCSHTTLLTHTTCPHTTYSHTALGDMDMHSAWQAWHLSYWAGSGGALGPRWAPWSPPPFAWQAWHFATSTFALHGRRGTSRHRPSLCVAGVALGDMDVHSAWQAWHLSYLAGSGGALGPCWTPWSPFAWQAWHFATSTFTLRGQRTCILRGRRGTYRTGLALVARLGPVGRRGRRRRLRGRHGTSRHRPSLCVAGVALMAPTTCPPSASAAHAHTHCAHTRMHTHTHTHAVSCTILSHTYALLHTLLSRTSLRHTFVAHADPSPSLISFLHFPSHLYLSFAAYWTTLEEVDMWGYPVL